MKSIKYIVTIAMLLIAPLAMSENDEELSIAIATSTGTPVKRSPMLSDINLYIELDGVIIEFNGDYGEGYAELRNQTTGESISSNIYAQNGGTEQLYLSMSSSSSYELTITFDDGRYGSIAWWQAILIGSIEIVRPFSLFSL